MCINAKQVMRVSVTLKTKRPILIVGMQPRSGSVIRTRTRVTGTRNKAEKRSFANSQGEKEIGKY